MYCLYTNWDAKRHRAKPICLNCKPSIRHYGTSILSAKSVQCFLPRKIKHLDSLYNDLKPMHCILCPKSRPASGDLPERSLEYLQRNKLIENVKEENNTKSFLRQQPPLYVTRLINKTYDIRDNAEDDYETIDSALPIDDQRLKYITIIEEKQI
ncbi:hypothetical protein HRM2_44700 [Desulforapulum autotrophicum HRM2]|uniref:Uncharacterized protein n=1 Tax=Desulforapulum autotrophicum (strain ATCC 43914 / DSM 3382 / VKM B-1955 / HRM2) TaxID=177437 RepID=C0QF25_DESAH|nr:hypothetical protein HRM2_44700 [Desulforapulum autotrophicum HRM2]